MTELQNGSGGVSYPTPVARTLADLAGYLGDDWAFFASDLTREASEATERGKYGDEARDWLYAEITGTHVNPDEWSKPEPPAGFMNDLSTGLDLDNRQRMRLAMVYSYGSEEGPKLPNGPTPPRAGQERTPDVFRRYPGAMKTKTKAECSVSHPDAGGQCPRAVVGEVWALPFCDLHGREAEMAAYHEIGDAANRELQGYADALANRWPADEYIIKAIESADIPVPSYDHREHARIIREAYPPETCRIHPDTTAYAYDNEYAGDGPVDWWNDARELAVRHVREAGALGVPNSLDLELLRQQTTVQQMLAEEDFERRYMVRARAERDDRKRKEGELKSV